ncbi:sensor histidine kinase [Mycobacterium camsae]|uniref:sensor histidine kinase n=1 Tax=Mycobacterium gordonae TaxID=1778 RepID=UPI001F1196E9|nr:HAMP domain-containing sensor histidine kinase [Mycobacterium gordonae]
MRPLDELRADVGAEDYGLARTVVAVRVAVVISIGALLAIGPYWVREHAAATVVVLGAAMAYAATLMAHPQLEVRRTRYAWLVTAFDAAFTLALIALSGGVYSPVVSVLALAVIASAARLSLVETFLLAVLLGAAYVPVALTASPRQPVTAAPALLAGWSALYLLFVAIITAGLSALAEREHRSRVSALVEAQAEHAAAEEERDLRARLLRSYQSQQDGLQVLVHEFRTPVTSLEALTEALTSGAPMTDGDRRTSLQLVARHVRHIADMLEALSDVALSRRPTFTTGQVRRVDVADLILGAADAVELAPPRLQLKVDVGAVAVDAQALRRVLTNLLENAARHGRGEPVDVTCWRDGEELVVAVADRGPGVPAASLGELTTKYVSVGGQRGTAGLGLWIVQQIVEAMGGRVDFAARDGGGLIATFRAPVT